MQKIACIFSFKMSSWVSCQKIVFNLHKAYHLNEGFELLNFNYSLDQTPGEILETSKQIINAQPDIIVIIDHKPHPYTLLQLVLPFMEKRPRIILHIFGDFTLNYAKWDKLGRLVPGYKIDFLVASDRQKHLLDKYLPETVKSQVCPFPVDKNEFSYNPALRTLQRKEWGLKDDDMAFVFTGRLSRQKRIHTLLRAFSEFLEKTGAENAHLFLYGQPDHVADQFIGKWEVEGEYFRKISRVYKSLPEHVQKKIHFMGIVPNIELKSVYQAADMLVNLSVHNDEDYGMSVAEAQCSGLPAILTDWGGLASFHQEDLPEATFYIPVKIGQRGKLIKFSLIVQGLENAYHNGHFKERKLLSEISLNKFGVEKASEIISKVLITYPDHFTEFSPFFQKVLSRVLFTEVPYIDEYKNIIKIYHEIYSSYVRNP